MHAAGGYAGFDLPSPAPAPAKGPLRGGLAKLDPQDWLDPQSSGTAGDIVSASAFIPDDFYDVISGDLIQDAVMADDGHSYSRQTITDWFDACIAANRPPTSPLTREVLRSKNLRANITLQKAIDAYVAQKDAAAAGYARSQALLSPFGREVARADASTARVVSLHQLSQTFQMLDRMRALLDETLHGWQPPQLVAIGNEKAGKSTLLERLCMMPIFPHAEELCTRMKIQVRLRNVAKAVAPVLEVYDTRRRRTEYTRTVPMDGARIDVREAMDDLVRRQNQRITGITDDYVIILHVKSPNVPTLDLVDLPGVVTAATENEPKNMPHQTQSLVQSCINESKDFSLFLCAVPAPLAPNASTGVQLLADANVLHKTIGVVTMCDDLAIRHQSKLRLRLEQKGDAVVLEPHGWIATMNCPVESTDAQTSNYKRLIQQAEAEPVFFKENNLGDLIDKGLATTDALMDKVTQMFLSYLKRTWLPRTMDMLRRKQESYSSQDRSLGLPAALGNLSESELHRLRSRASHQITAVLATNVDWMMDCFYRHVVSPLRQRLSELTVNRRCELGSVGVYLESLSDDVQRSCARQRTQFAEVLSRMVRVVLQADGTSTSRTSRDPDRASHRSRDPDRAGTSTSRTSRDPESASHRSRDPDRASHRSPTGGRGGQSRYSHGADCAPHDRDEFVISRFPETIESVVLEMQQACAVASASLVAAIEKCVDFHFSVPSSTMRVAYRTNHGQYPPQHDRRTSSSTPPRTVEDDFANWTKVGVMHAELTFDAKAIEQDFEHAFMEHAAKIIQSTVLNKNKVKQLVEGSIIATTRESCHAQRLQLRTQLERVNAAIDGMQPVFGSIKVDEEDGGVEEVHVGQRIEYQGRSLVLQSVNGQWFNLVDDYQRPCCLNASVYRDCLQQQQRKQQQQRQRQAW